MKKANCLWANIDSTGEGRGISTKVLQLNRPSNLSKIVLEEVLYQSVIASLAYASILDNIPKTYQSDKEFLMEEITIWKPPNHLRKRQS